MVGQKIETSLERFVDEFKLAALHYKLIGFAVFAVALAIRDAGSDISLSLDKLTDQADKLATAVVLTGSKHR